MWSDFVAGNPHMQFLIAIESSLFIIYDYFRQALLSVSQLSLRAFRGSVNKIYTISLGWTTGEHRVVLPVACMSFSAIIQ